MHIQLLTCWLFTHSCSGPSTSRWLYIFVFLLVFTIVTHMCLPMPAHPSLCPFTCACLGMPCFPTLGGIEALSLWPTSLLPPWHFGPMFFLPQCVCYPIQLFIFWAFIWWPPACFSVVHIHTTHPPTPLPAVTCMHLPTPAFLPVPTHLHLLYAPNHLPTPTSACPCTSASASSALPLTSCLVWVQMTQEWTWQQEYSSVHEFNLFFSLCSCLFLCCSDSHHSPTYASACCCPHALAYPHFPTVLAHHVHLPPPALPLPAHAHAHAPAHVHPHTPTPTHCCACPCLPAYAWVSSLYFFFFMLVLIANPHCLHHCLALAIPIPQWAMSTCAMATKCLLSYPWLCPPAMPATWPTFPPLAMPATFVP